MLSLAQRLVTRRKQLGLNQTDLAKLAGTTQQTINKIETGEILRPRKIKAIADALKVSPAWLQFGAASIDKLDHDAILLAQVWMDLPEPHRSAVKEMILKMSKNPGKSKK